MDAVTCALLVLCALIALKSVDNWIQLRRAPGPALASITDFWRAWHQYRGQLREKLVQLHEKHGPIVRYGVRSLSISDPSAINVIYGSKGFVTADSYKVLVGISNGKEVTSLVSTSDEARHGAMRRAVASAFTPNGVLAYESFMDATIVELLELLRTKAKTGAAFDLAGTILYFSIDSAERFSFGESLGCLQAEGDVGGTIQLIRDRFNHWGWWGSLPWLERLVYRNPLAMRRTRPPSSMVAAALSKLQARKSAGDEERGGGPADLLSSFIEAGRAHPDVLDTPGIVGMLMSTISGAGDTTASSLAAALYFLNKNPSALAKLREELAAAQLSRPVPQFSEVAKLSYLHGAIREAMRLSPTATWPLERRVPLGGVTLAGMYIPEGTSVGTMLMATHLDRAVFGEDAHAFRPERWLTANAEEARRMEGAFMGFSRGKRVCLGQHIAVMQMKKVLAVLTTDFDLSPVNPNAKLEYDMSPAVVCVKPFQVTVEKRTH